jgi:HTH-type transcriptional regulator/antitoxin HigA
METDMKTGTLRPFRPIRPGEILQEEIDARGWSQIDLAQVLARPVQAVNEIIAGKKAITPETAVALSKALGTSPEYWLNLESSLRPRRE